MSLREYLPKFKDSIQFSLNIKTKACALCPKEEKQKDCLSEGQYCPIAPRQKDDDQQIKKIAQIGGCTFLMQSLLVKIVQESLQDDSLTIVSSKDDTISILLDYLILVRRRCCIGG